MGFPQESIDRAEEIAGKYRLRSKGKVSQARYLFDGKFLHVDYGYDDAMENANAGPHLHEMVKSATCFAYGGALYLIAKSLQLQPTLWKARGMKDVEDGQNPEKIGLADHTFITCDLNASGIRVLDPHYSLWGKVKMDTPRNRWHIFTKNPEKRVTRTFESLEPLTEEAFLSELEHHRTPEGGREVLAATQKVHSHNNHWIQITYDPDVRTLRCRTIFGSDTVREEPHLASKAYDLVRPVKPDGIWVPNAGTLLFTECKSTGWGTLEGARTPFEYPYAQAKKLWIAWQELFSHQEKNKDISRLGSQTIFEGLYGFGLRKDFSYTPEGKLLAEKTNVLSVLDSARRTAARMTTRYLENVRNDEIGYKYLLDHAHYMAACKGEGPRSWVYTSKEHDALFIQALDGRMESFGRMVDQAQLTLKITGRLEPGCPDQAQRDLNAAINAEQDMSTRAYAMAESRKKRNSSNFSSLADLTLWRNDRDIDTMSVSQLEQGLTQKSMRDSVKYSLFSGLLTACGWHKVLKAGKYEKGIAKVLRL